MIRHPRLVLVVIDVGLLNERINLMSKQIEPRTHKQTVIFKFDFINFVISVFGKWLLPRARILP